MEVEASDELPSHASSRPMAPSLQKGVAQDFIMEYNIRQRSSSLDNERLWRPASGFALKHKADLEAKRLLRERKQQRARQIQEGKNWRNTDSAKGSKPNDHHVVKDVSHDCRGPDEYYLATDISPDVPSDLLDFDLSLSVDGLSVSSECSLSQEEIEATEVTRRKRRQQMKRRQNKALSDTRDEAMTGIPHPSLLGKVLFLRRSTLQRLADELYLKKAIAMHSERKVRANPQSCNFPGAASFADGLLRKTKSTSSMAHQIGGARLQKLNTSAKTNPPTLAHRNRRARVILDPSRSACSPANGHGSPRLRKCGDKRDFFFRNLAYELRNQLQVDKVAEFSVTDFEMATKISHVVLNLFVPFQGGIVAESGDTAHEDSNMINSERAKHPLIVTDGTACVGGNVLSFCDFFAHVNAIENDFSRVQMLQHNLQVLQKTNVKCIHANYLDVMLQLKQDVVFLDPPWGGPEYKDLERVDLFLGGQPLHEICSRLQGSTKCIVLKVPSNFDEVKFSQNVPGKVVIRRDLKKMHLVLLDFR
ncbi:hypothetical protein CCR75_007163 [Bremia lactucae]|uniref:Trimethylguanosine synthase n=1 Tax=Bremia lactucae TaxID=4779 RepID=A0A976IFP6_BRELC|nr:hypothetical protein CCR75_007163 [Bremia lactucae]